MFLRRMFFWRVTTGHIHLATEVGRQLVVGGGQSLLPWESKGTHHPSMPSLQEIRPLLKGGLVPDHDVHVNP